MFDKGQFFCGELGQVIDSMSDSVLCECWCVGLCAAQYCWLNKWDTLCIVNVNRACWLGGLAWEQCECWKASILFLSVYTSTLNSTRRSPKHRAVAKLGLTPFSSGFLLALLLLFAISHLAESTGSMENSRTFLYFAYGSNLLRERLQLGNPSAMIHCVAKLKVIW